MEYLDFAFEVKTLADAGQFEGYASTFGNTDLGGDIVLPGAFTNTLNEHAGKVPILMGHSQGRIVGFGISAEQDARGLKVTGAFTLRSTEGRDAYETTKHAEELGHKLGLSIGYGVRKNGAEYDEEKGIRKLKDLNLYEYSIAAVPMNQRARVARVKAAGWTIREFEQHLRDVGLPMAAARKVASGGWAALDPRDVEDPAAVTKRANDAFMAEVRRAAFMLELRKGL